MDNSAVFHIDTLEEEFSEKFDTSRPWVFETDDSQKCFASEDDACAAQREYREAYGFDAITGERKAA